MGLRLESVTVRYPVRGERLRPAHLTAVSDVDLAIAPGEVVGIVGESGCGKSTVARTLVGLERPHRGRVWLGDANVWEMRPRERRQQLARRVAMVFQDPTSSLNARMSVGELVSDPLRIHRVGSRSTRWARARDLLDRVGLPTDALARRPQELSGGQRQRVAIARALALEPTIVVADEPTSALDVSIRAQVLNLLLALREQLGLGLALVSHDIQTVRYIADRVTVMYLGRVVERGPAAEIVHHARHPYSAALFSAAPTLRGRGRDRIVLTGRVASPRDPPSGCPFRTRCWRADDTCARTFPEPSGAESHSVWCHHPLDGGPAAARPAP